jgi:hypothetical protein
MLWSGFQLAIYFLVNTFYSKGTPALRVTLALCLHWERVPSHGRHLAIYGHQKHCGKKPSNAPIHITLLWPSFRHLNKLSIDNNIIIISYFKKFSGISPIWETTQNLFTCIYASINKAINQLILFMINI